MVMVKIAKRVAKNHDGLDRKKLDILRKALQCHEAACRGELKIAGLLVKSSVIYRTGKYDEINWPGFPDEGYRFYFDDERLSHLTIRPSGTSNTLRFHVQLFGGHPSPDQLIARKRELREGSAAIVTNIRQLIGANC